MFSAIILAAGSSTRFGSPKALAPLARQTVIEHLVNMLIKSGVNEIIIVLGDHERTIRPKVPQHPKITVTINEQFTLGQTSSFQKGIQNVPLNSQGILLFPVDVPAIQISTIDALINHFLKNDTQVLIPTFQGQKGHPPIFHRDLIEPLLEFPNDKGLNIFIQSERFKIKLLEVDDPGVTMSFNTPEEFEMIKSYLAA